MQNSLSSRWLHAFFAVCLSLFFHTVHAADALPPPGALTPENAMAVIQSQGKDLTIIDVRTPSEFANGHIKDAKSIPLQTLETNLDKIPSGPVLLVCRAGVRAGKAYGIISKVFPNKNNLWYLKGSPVYHADGTYEFQ